MFTRKIATINSKLTEDEVKQIRQILVKTPLTQREIGEIYDVEPSTISSIQRNESWSWLD